MFFGQEELGRAQFPPLHLTQHLSGEGRFVRTNLFLGVSWVDRFECGICLLMADMLIDPLACDGEEFPGLLIHIETR